VPGTQRAVRTERSAALNSPEIAERNRVLGGKGGRGASSHNLNQPYKEQGQGQGVITSTSMDSVSAIVQIYLWSRMPNEGRSNMQGMCEERSGCCGLCRVRGCPADVLCEPSEVVKVVETRRTDRSTFVGTETTISASCSHSVFLCPVC
jgi:hypothetical protein